MPVTTQVNALAPWALSSAAVQHGAEHDERDQLGREGQQPSREGRAGARR